MTGALKSSCHKWPKAQWSFILEKAVFEAEYIIIHLEVCLLNFHSRMRNVPECLILGPRGWLWTSATKGDSVLQGVWWEAPWHVEWPWFPALSLILTPIHGPTAWLSLPLSLSPRRCWMPGLPPFHPLEIGVRKIQYLTSIPQPFYFNAAVIDLM